MISEADKDTAKIQGDSKTSYCRETKTQDKPPRMSIPTPDWAAAQQCSRDSDFTRSAP